jgi:hypothetical protein
MRQWWRIDRARRLSPRGEKSVLTVPVETLMRSDGIRSFLSWPADR